MTKYAILDVSTCHIELADARLLQSKTVSHCESGDGEEAHQWLEADIGEAYIYPTSRGWVLKICSNEDPIDETLTAAFHGFSQAFQDLLAYARKQDCFWMQLHGDGYEIDDLATFEW